jgi:Spy/CpxP family protein refolding chaperone
MKKIILGMLAMVTTVATIQAQDQKEMRHGHHKRSHDGVSMEKLNLTEQQKAQMKTIRADFGKQMAELKKNENITVKEYRSRMDAIRKDHKEKIQGIFTPEQKAQVEKMKAESKAKHEEFARARTEKFKKELGLSDEQSAKLNQLHAGTAEKMKALHENASLSKEEKKEHFKALAKAQHEEFKSVLTAEQLQKMEEMKKTRHSQWAK